MGRKAKDLTGQKFGRLTVIEYVGKSKWLCKCECGNTCKVVGADLKRGNTKSCGCYHKEKSKEKFDKLNEIQKGEKHPRYNPNITDEEREQGRFTHDDYEWKQEVKRQANYTCDICGKRGRKTTFSPLKRLSFA